MPLLSNYSRKKKIEYFFKYIPKQCKILEVGCGEGWLGKYLRENGWKEYVGLDLFPPADIIGDILDWRRLGIKEESFDVIVAFEVVEHIHCFQEFFNILKPGGVLILTSPVPHMDWLCKFFEFIKLNQKRTSPHEHLIYFKNIPFFKPVKVRVVCLMAQWGIFQKEYNGKR